MTLDEIIFDLFIHFNEVKGYNNTLWAVNKTLFNRKNDTLIAFDTVTCAGSLYITFVNAKTGATDNYFIHIDDDVESKIKTIKHHVN